MVMKIQGSSVCIDNTNPSSEVRSLYIKEAQKRGLPCRCLVFTTSLKLAQHLNCFRQKLTHGVTSKIPEIGNFTFGNYF